jgi:small subunit ribosomal protein S1
MSLGIKQLKLIHGKTSKHRFAEGSKHAAKVRNFTNFGVFVEIEEGVDRFDHISDLSWTKKIKHPSEFTSDWCRNRCSGS